jgi:hypothetical protein
MRAIVTWLLLAVPAFCAGADSFLFPHDFVRGYADFEVSPPHNERDLGRCASDAGTTSDPAAPCAAFTRYLLGGYVEFQPLGRKLGPLPLQRLFVFLEPRTFLGRNLPQVQYSASMEAIMFERAIGLGVVLPKNFEFRVWQHRNYWLGRYSGTLGAPDLGGNGPYGLHAGLALRWYYGWGRRPVLRRFVRGFAEFELDPPHNERDLGRCTAGAGSYGGADAPCGAFSRYSLGGYVEVQPFSRKLGPLPLQRLLFILEPRFFFGRNVPQFRYSASMAPILFERSIGLGIELPRRFEFRLMQHRNAWLGRYSGYLGPADLGPNGPYGLFASVGLRWYFGGWGRHPSP